MLFWGWGSSSRQKKISETQVVINRFKYFQLIFINRLTWGYNYVLATSENGGWHYKDLTKEEALQLTGGDELMPNWWARYSLYLGLSGIVLAIITSIVSSAR